MSSARWLTMADAAKRVRKDPRTLRRWVADGDLDQRRVAGLIVVSEAQLLQVEKARRERMHSGKRRDPP
ncbi:helix-turn-helix domain-containing protein [Microbacterium dauci]|uniref:Helix-turn-helix domain-containing protein n=1 Tax=Microbacterium dauci TaxID=3048008 RepID=A0ABT6ZC53_9MICO|nr:helix-turn-helix domain-containing protein [Microbacterium sp. LX3-4]MDJ1113222.1 helix-turn-helix domain-containing protein [Microbacterium sp. LX3-4]